MKTLKQIVLDFDKCDVQVLSAAMTSEEREGGREGGREGVCNFVIVMCLSPFHASRGESGHVGSSQVL